MMPQASAYVLAVPDAETTARWWTERLAFERRLTIPGWVFVGLGACEIRLGTCADALPVSELGDHSYFGYVMVDVVDEFHARLSDRPEELLFAPRAEPWGTREMGVRTPDGHRVIFAERSPD